MIFVIAIYFEKGYFRLLARFFLHSNVPFFIKTQLVEKYINSVFLKILLKKTNK